MSFSHLDSFDGLHWPQNKIQIWLLPLHLLLSAFTFHHRWQSHMPEGLVGSTPGWSSPEDGYMCVEWRLEKVPASKGGPWLLLPYWKEDPMLLEPLLFCKKRQKDGYLILKYPDLFLTFGRVFLFTLLAVLVNHFQDTGWQLETCRAVL